MKEDLGFKILSLNEAKNWFDIRERKHNPFTGSEMDKLRDIYSQFGFMSNTDRLSKVSKFFDKIKSFFRHKNQFTSIYITNSNSDCDIYIDKYEDEWFYISTCPKNYVSSSFVRILCDQFDGLCEFFNNLDYNMQKLENEYNIPIDIWLPVYDIVSAPATPLAQIYNEYIDEQLGQVDFRGYIDEQIGRYHTTSTTTTTTTHHQD